MSKPKARIAPARQTGVYKPDSIKDVAESLNISNLSDPVASALASDVEYRIQQVIDEAARFMRHGRRTTMTTADVEHALRVLNIEPLYGHSPHIPPTFRRVLSSAPPVFFVEDEEVDFDRFLREEKITLPKGVSYTAHWLAIEGVQPLIPENPPAIPRDVDLDVAKAAERPQSIIPQPPLSPTRLTANQTPKKQPQQPQQQPQQQQQLLVKQVLSRELQLYYARLTSSLLPPTIDHVKRTAALASLRNDAGLQALLPYLVRWVGEGVVDALKEDEQLENSGRVLEVLLDVTSAILDNTTLLVEPYLHQILPPILSTLLHSTLPPTHATDLRISASQTLSRLLTQHSTTYPSLSPRIMKTLLLALISVGKSKGTREGAVHGLVSIGKEAVRKGLVQGGGAKVVGSECAPGESGPLVDAVMNALRVLYPPSEDPVPLDGMDEGDIAIAATLREVLGDFFAEAVIADAAWAKGILSGDEQG